MKAKRLFVFLLTLVLMTGIAAVPAKADVKTYTDVEVIQAQEETSYLTPGKSNIQQYSFTQKSQGKWIPIKPKAEGILHVGYEISLYDANKKKITGAENAEDQDIFVKGVKKTDVFYIKLPDQIQDEITVYASIKKDYVKELGTRILYTQSGQNKNIYQTFKVKKRCKQSIYLFPLFDNASDVTFYLQRKEKGIWKTISKKLKSNGNDHVRMTYVFGLKIGQYRLVSKASANQIYQLSLENKSITSKYQTKKSKAQKVKLKTTKANIYTTTEKAPRWYRVYRKTAKHKRYVKLSVKNNSGSIKFSIYKKGKNKALKTYTLSENKSKTFRLNKGKGTYYIKVGKSGLKMNGYYEIQYK